MIRATLADLNNINEWAERDNWWAPGRELDFSHFLNDPTSICLIEGEGGVFFVWRGPGIYELHLFMTHRGHEAVSVLSRCLDHMRSEYAARLFWAAIPLNGSKESRKVRLFARWMGWKSHGRANLAHGLCEIVSAE